MAIDWDGVAEKADAGIPGILGKLHRLHDEGKLEMLVVAYAYRLEDGSIGHSYTWEPDNDIWAIGLLEAVKMRMISPENQRTYEGY